VQIRPILEKDISLKKENFRVLEFWIYRGFRLLLLPFGRAFSVKIAARLHWIFRHLAIATASNAYGIEFLNSRSAIIQGDFLKLYISQGDSIVDVACGTARYFPTISEISGAHYLGIDSSSLHISRNIAKHPRGQFKQANCLEKEVIPKCDVIIASHFIEHLENPLQFLLLIKERCSKLIIEVPDFFSDPINLVSHNLNTPWWSDSDHQREYSEITLENLLIEADFKIINRKIFGGTIGVVAVPSTQPL
jgi:SAM-dependent methyltransferase